MATVTPNFNWPVPTSTDLVKDGATAIEALGDSIDASLVDLKGGTTGQVLSKTSNTDMDFTWVAADDTNAIQNTIVDAKGDLIAASAADTPARLAVGSNGETLVADSSTSTGLRYTGNYAAGKNAVINGAMYWAQRGTTFTNPASSSYTLDRWLTAYDGSGGTRVISQEVFTPGTAPVAGYEANFFLRINQSVAPTSNTYVDIRQRLENVSTFAGQIVTVSFWAKANANRTITALADQDFGSGGSSRVFNALPAQGFTVTTSWQRFTYTGTVASISGKTVGTSSYVDLTFRTDSTGGTFTMDIWGVQIESGSVATAFQTATGTLQGELAACQRYYWRDIGPVNQTIPIAYQTNSTTFGGNNPVVMRVSPSVSTTYQNANYTTAWYLVQPTRTTTTKTGSVAFSFFSTPQTWAICIDGGTFSPAPTAFQGGTPNYFEASAEL
jgi:hypothetical protein